MTKKNAEAPVTTVETQAKLAMMRAAQRAYGQFTQEDVDRIFRAGATTPTPRPCCVSR